MKEFAKAFNNDTQVPPAIRQAQKEAERQKQILAVLEREQKQFEEMQKSSEAFRRKVREEQAKKENLEKQRAAMLSQPPGMLSILVRIKALVVLFHISLIILFIYQKMKANKPKHHFHKSPKI